jgi:hypothetical protein
MAQKRRGGGGAFRPPELKGTLGTLLRSTLHQAGVVRDAVGEALGQGRQQRKRQDALAELGEVVLELVRKGEIDLGELPEAREVIRQLDEMDSDTEDGPEEIAQPTSRKRFDTRGDDGTVSSGARWAPAKPAKPVGERVWRPPVEEPAPQAAAKQKQMPVPGVRKGGISFDNDDDDLAEYMHPDDVPPKPSTDE